MRCLKTVASLLLILALLPSAGAGQAKVGAPAPDFVLKDQYDQEFKLSQRRGTVLLIIYGDREGSSLIDNWARAVREKYTQERVKIVPIISFEGVVPWLLRGYAKGKFRGTTPQGQPKSAKLLDWDGALTRQYGSREKLANVYLIDAQGVLQYAAAGKGLTQETEPLRQAIERVLKAK